MKKMKKLFAILMTMAMVMGLGITGFAAIDGASIEVKGLSTAAAQEVKVYEIFTTDTNANDWVKASWLSSVNVTPETLGNSDVVAAIKNAVNNTTPVADSITTGTDDVFQNSVTLDGNDLYGSLKAGAYLVLVTDTSNKVTYNPMVAVTYEYNNDGLMVAKTNTPVTAKAESYSTDKTQKDEDTIVEVGDLIEYEITTTVPYVENKNPEEFWVEDELSGATYFLTGTTDKGEKAVSSVTVNGETIDGISIPSDAQGGTTFTIDLSKLLTTDNTYAGQKVVITYTAKVAAVDTITNKALSSNDPNEGENDGKTTNKTGQIQITKYGEEENGVRPELAGAQFAVYRYQKNEEGEDTSTKEYATISNGYITGAWTQQKSDGSAPDNVSTITTDKDGIAIVKGLDVGTYYFEEIVAPNGYSINEAAADCEITAADLTGETTMNDDKMAELPSTGGMGTTLFTIAGCVIMISAAGLFFATRKKAN